jgi:hypothetical protein
MYSREISAKTAMVMINAPTVFPTITSRAVRHNGQAARNATAVGTVRATPIQNKLILSDPPEVPGRTPRSRLLSLEDVANGHLLPIRFERPIGYLNRGSL